MALTPYCVTDEVRATLGVNAIELSDTVLNLPVYQIGLLRELAKVSPSLSASFVTLSDKSPPLTALEQALVDATHLFAVYACAKQVGVSLGSLMPKQVGDGKATTARFTADPYKDTLARIDTFYQSTRADLLSAVDDYNVTPEPDPVLIYTFVASTPSYDPVTG